MTRHEAQGTAKPKEEIGYHSGYQLSYGPVGWIEFLDLVPAGKNVLGSGVGTRADFPSEGVEPG